MEPFSTVAVLAVTSSGVIAAVTAVSTVLTLLFSGRNRNKMKSKNGYIDKGPDIEITSVESDLNGKASK